MLWLTADTHFSHTNILEYCNRPFSSIEEHDQTLIDNINAVYKPGDELWHLGDFAFGSAVDILRYRRQIAFPYIHFLMGNHDVRNEHYIRNNFIVLENCYHYEADELELPIIFNHYALRVWDRSHYGSMHLHGHSHGRLKMLGRSMDVGVDAVGYKPISIEECYSRLIKIEPHDKIKETKKWQSY